MVITGAFPVPIEAIGLVAGVIIITSAIPQLIANIRNVDGAASQSLARNLALVAGNVLWVVYGVVKGAPSIAVMCATAAALNGGVAVQVLRSRRRQSPPNQVSAG